MSELLQDLQFGLRTLRKSRGFAFVALATLAVGIGANTAIFSFLDGVLLRPLPYPEPARIVRVLEKPPGGEHNGISTLNYLDWARDNTVFEHMSAETGGSVILSGVEEPEQLSGLKVSAHYFDIFQVKMALGRTFAEGEDEPGKDHVVVISYALWTTRFANDPTILGRSLLLNDEPHTVIGVLAQGSAFDRGWAVVWTPLAFGPEKRTRNFHWLGASALLKRGVTIDQARAQMNTIAARIARDYPDSNKNWGAVIDSYSDLVAGKSLRDSIQVMSATVAMVLLIACANLANLTLARGLAREREVAIRSALGAGRWRLVRQFLTESILLSLGGGVLGLFVGYLTIAGLKLAIPAYTLPRETTVELDSRVLLFTFGLSVLTGVLFGLVPAMHAARADLTASIKEGGTGGSAGGASRRLRGALVVGEVALAFVLLTAAGLLLRSFYKIEKVDPGFDSTNVLTADFPIPEKQFPNADAFRSYISAVTEKMASLPGVRHVAFTSALPMEGWGYGMPFQLADRPKVDPANRPACFFKMVSPAYFSALGIKLLKGRPLSEHDTQGAPPVTVIGQSMAKKYFPNEEPIGKRILVQQIILGKPELGPEIPWEVIGVVADESIGRLNDKKEDNPGIYVNLAQSPQLYQAVVVRGSIDPTLLRSPLAKAIRELNQNQTFTNMKTLEQIKVESMGDSRLRSRLLTIFAVIALVLAALGIYGVMSYHVVQRTREIGIRSALGATSGDILVVILRSGLSLVGIGLVVGVMGIFLLTRFLSSLLFEIEAHDPLTVASVAFILGAVAFVACYVPARRATKVDPLIALRHD